MKLPLDIIGIREYLPHRYPMALVDRVIGCTDTDILGFKNITINEQLLQGHFPLNPIFPGVLMIEALAQIAGIHAFERLNKRPADGMMFLFAGVDDVRFKRQVTAGDKLELNATFSKSRQNFYWYDCVATVEQQVVCQATIMLVLQSLQVI